MQNRQFRPKSKTNDVVEPRRSSRARKPVPSYREEVSGVALQCSNYHNAMNQTKSVTLTQERGSNHLCIMEYLKLVGICG